MEVMVMEVTDMVVRIHILQAPHIQMVVLLQDSIKHQKQPLQKRNVDFVGEKDLQLNILQTLE